MNNIDQNNVCDNTTREAFDKAKKEIEECRRKIYMRNSFVKGCIVLNIFTILINLYPITKKLQESLVNKDFTIISLIVLSVFSFVSLVIPLLEELDYRKLLKYVTFGEESEDDRIKKEKKIEEFYNKYNSWYKIQELSSNVLKVIAIGFLVYFLGTHGIKFDV